MDGYKDVSIPFKRFQFPVSVRFPERILIIVLFVPLSKRKLNTVGHVFHEISSVPTATRLLLSGIPSGSGTIAEIVTVGSF